MAKVKKSFFCKNCGHSSPKWIGKCTACNEWNTYSEEIISKDDSKQESRTWANNEKRTVVPIPLQDVQGGKTIRIPTPDKELNRVLGGGIVAGSVILIGGQPGIGKSTLILQTALRLPLKVLYVTGEESEEQIKMRAERIGIQNKSCYILTETNTQKLFQQFAKLQPQILVIDSIQTLSSPFLESPQGSVSQIRECAGELQRLAKETNVPVIVIGHITKDGSIAGPKLLEHIVDTVLQFEGDQHYTYRILRTIKNRYGSSAELGIYEMRADGLREVSNPSELLLNQKEEELSGSAVCATLEGLRPMLVETQALVSTAVYGNPQRSANGFDMRRLSMLLAVLEKRGGFKFGLNDVFLNIAGGLKIDDPAIDLAIVSALVSSLQDIVVPGNICFAGEVGLSGEIRAVTRIDQRIQEADRLGFKEIYISKYNLKGLDLSQYSIKVNTVAKVDELFEQLFG